MCAKAWADLMSDVGDFFGVPEISSLFTMDGEAILDSEFEGEAYERQAVAFIKLMELGPAVKWLVACEDSVFEACSDAAVAPAALSLNQSSQASLAMTKVLSQSKINLDASVQQ